MQAIALWVIPGLTEWMECLPGAVTIELIGALLTVAAVGAFLRWRASSHWRRRELLNRINISLNAIQDGVLLIRTLYESDLDDVFPNREAVRTVLRLAGKTSMESPILPLANTEEDRQLLNSVLNVISQQFGAGLVRRDIGLPTRSESYVICLTCEDRDLVRTHKVRAMVVREDTLMRFAGEFKTKEPDVERKHHRTRVRTLREMAAAYAAEPHRFMTVEVCIAEA